MLYWIHGKPEYTKGGLPSIIGGADPPDQRGKEGDANVRYIFGSDPDRYLIGFPCQSHVWDFQRKKIAAHYCE